LYAVGAISVIDPQAVESERKYSLLLLLLLFRKTRKYWKSWKNYMSKMHDLQ